MYGDSGRPLIGSSKLLIIFIVAIVVVMAGTVVLNGGFSAPSSEVAENNTTEAEQDVPEMQYQMVGHNSYGTVTKITGFGNPSSDIKVALIVGVDAKQKTANAVIPTLQNDDMFNYCYDVYIINTTYSSNNDSNEYNESNLTINEMSESLASEYVVPDIIKNNYNFTVDIHSTNDSNSYVFVPSEDTYTSKIVVDYISNNTNVGKYTPESHSYTQSISEKIIANDIPSIVYVTREYYDKNVSSEINSIISAIDSFDFVNLFNADYSTVADDSTSNDNATVTEVATNDEENQGNTTSVSNSSGYQEVN